MSTPVKDCRLKVVGENAIVQTGETSWQARTWWLRHASKGEMKGDEMALGNQKPWCKLGQPAYSDDLAVEC